jgi:hypothetical protein
MYQYLQRDIQMYDRFYFYEMLASKHSHSSGKLTTLCHIWTKTDSSWSSMLEFVRLADKILCQKCPYIWALHHKYQLISKWKNLKIVKALKNKEKEHSRQGYRYFLDDTMQLITILVSGLPWWNHFTTTPRMLCQFSFSFRIVKFPQVNNIHVQCMIAKQNLFIIHRKPLKSEIVHW